MTDISPKQIAALRRQLQVANARLISLERERREAKQKIAELVAFLNSSETPAGHPDLLPVSDNLTEV